MAELKDRAVIEAEMQPEIIPDKIAAGISKYMTEIRDRDLKRDGPLDQRTIGRQNIMRESDMRVAQLGMNERQLEKAKVEVVDLTARRAQLTDAARKYEQMRQNPDTKSRIEGCTAEIARVQALLNHQSANFERFTKIVTAGKKLLAEFMEARPFKGALTNGEVIEEMKELDKLDKVVANTPVSISLGPSVL